MDICFWQQRKKKRHREDQQFISVIVEILLFIQGSDVDSRIDATDRAFVQLEIPEPHQVRSRNRRPTRLYRLCR